MMKVLSLYSIKGGVGKTAAAVNLAHMAALDGLRTLLLDLDPQGAASFYFRVRPRKKADVDRFLAGGDGLQRAIRATDYPNLDILPAHLSFRRMELALDAIKKPSKHMHKVLRPQRRDHDLVVIDCPPTLTLVAESVIRASHLVLVPVVPTTLSHRTLEMLEAECASLDLDRKRLRAFFSLVDRRKKLHRELIDALPEKTATRFCRTPVPMSSDIERMGLTREPVACFAAQSAGAVAMQELWSELRDEI